MVNIFFIVQQFTMIFIATCVCMSVCVSVCVYVSVCLSVSFVETNYNQSWNQHS